MTERTGTFESWIEAPRWAGLKQAIEKGVMGYGLTRNYVREDKGFLRTTVYFSISGPEIRLLAFKAALEESLTEYNAY